MFRHQASLQFSLTAASCTTQPSLETHDWRASDVTGMILFAKAESEHLRLASFSHSLSLHTPRLFYKGKIMKRMSSGNIYSEMVLDPAEPGTESMLRQS